MTILTSASGARPLSLANGETLIIRNYSGTETVTGSTVAREDAGSVLGTGAVVYGPQTSSATVTISTTGTLDHSSVMGDPLPASDAALIVRDSSGGPSGLIDPVSGLSVGGSAFNGGKFRTIESMNTGITTASISAGGLSASGNTWQTIVGFRGKPYQVRVGYVAYNNTAGYTVTAASVTPSTTFVSSGGDPTVGTPVALTFGGSASGAIAGGASTTQEAVTWTDWVDCPGVERTDNPGAPYLLHIRTFFAANGGYNYNGVETTNTYTGNTATGLVRLGCGWVTGDKITSPSGYSPGGSLNNGLNIIVQIRTASRVVSVGAIGDSITAGGSTPTGGRYAAVSCRAVEILNSALGGYGSTSGYYDLTNYGVGATSHTQFYGRLPRILTDQAFNVFVLPVNSPNSPVATQSAWDAQVSRTLVGIQRLIDAGVVPVLLGTTPHNSASSTVEGFRLATDAFWRAQAPKMGALFVYFDDILSNKASPVAQWVGGLSADGLHPNDAGTALMAQEVASAIKAAATTARVL